MGKSSKYEALMKPIWDSVSAQIPEGTAFAVLLVEPAGHIWLTGNLTNTDPLIYAKLLREKARDIERMVAQSN